MPSVSRPMPNGCSVCRRSRAITGKFTGIDSGESTEHGNASVFKISRAPVGPEICPQDQITRNCLQKQGIASLQSNDKASSQSDTGKGEPTDRIGPVSPIFVVVKIIRNFTISHTSVRMSYDCRIGINGEGSRLEIQIREVRGSEVADRTTRTRNGSITALGNQIVESKIFNRGLGLQIDSTTRSPVIASGNVNAGFGRQSQIPCLQVHRSARTTGGTTRSASTNRANFGIQFQKPRGFDPEESTSTSAGRINRIPTATTASKLMSEGTVPVGLSGG